MLLEKIDDHYENIIVNFFEDYEIEKTKNGLLLKNPNENIEKLHSICKNTPENLKLNHVESIILLAKNRLIPHSLILLIDSLQEKIKETYFIDIIKEYQYFRFNIFHKKYEYKVLTFIDNHTNESTIKERIENFIYQDIKLPKFIIDKIIEDLEKSFLNGFDMDFSKYNKEIILASNDKTDFMIVYTNLLSGKQIVIHPIQINEQTGDLFFAGTHENILRL